MYSRNFLMFSVSRFPAELEPPQPLARVASFDNGHHSGTNNNNNNSARAISQVGNFFILKILLFCPLQGSNQQQFFVFVLGRYFWNLSNLIQLFHYSKLPLCYFLLLLLISRLILSHSHNCHEAMLSRKILILDKIDIRTNLGLESENDGRGEK